MEASILLFARTYLEELATPRSLSIYILLKDGSDEAWNQIFSLEFDPSLYLETDVDKARRDLAASAFFSKVPNFLNRDLKEAALDSFRAGEVKCKLTNSRIRDSLAGRNESVYQDITRVRDELRHVLGRAPSWSTVLELGEYGPNGSLLLSRSKASPDLKSMHDSSCTYQLACALSRRELERPIGLCRQAYWLAPGNLVTTVPKNAKTDRTIAIEPAVNSWCQKGIGEVIRRRLFRYGIDLNDQSLNQRAAEMALKRNYATIDLRNASNTIAFELVAHVLPPEWFELLNAVRSPRYTTDNRKHVIKRDAEWHEYEMFSSMGNGATFEMESAIFFAACLAAGCPPSEIFVYGDDLIVPQEYVATLERVLDSCGFEINPSKSFVNGLFFESCGVFFFNGVDVTPIKLKDFPNDISSSVVLVNKLSDSNRTALAYGLRPYVRATRLARTMVKTRIREHYKRSKKHQGKPKSELDDLASKAFAEMHGPYSMGGVIHASLDEAVLIRNQAGVKARIYGRGMFRCKSVAFIVREQTSEHAMLIERRLKVVGFSETERGNIVKEHVQLAEKFVNTSFSRWFESSKLA